MIRSLLPMALRALKTLFSRPATEPLAQWTRKRPAGARGQLTVDLGGCVFCGLCAKKCPSDAITVSREAKTFVIEQLRCISCGVCVDACNKDSLALETSPLPVQDHGAGHGRVELHKPDAPPAAADAAEATPGRKSSETKVIAA